MQNPNIKIKSNKYLNENVDAICRYLVLILIQVFFLWKESLHIEGAIYFIIKMNAVIKLANFQYLKVLEELLYSKVHQR